jgi:hypothetical protein
MTRRISAAIGSVIALGLAGMGPAFAASHPAPPPPRPPVAVVGPLIGAAQTGTSIGGPLVCSVAASVITDAIPGLSSATGTIVSACDTFAAQGAAQLAALNKAITPLDVINPGAHAGAEAAASLLNLIAERGSAIAPFGPDLTTLVADIQFFGGPG